MCGHVEKSTLTFQWFCDVEEVGGSVALSSEFPFDLLHYKRNSLRPRTALKKVRISLTGHDVDRIWIWMKETWTAHQLATLQKNSILSTQK